MSPASPAPTITTRGVSPEGADRCDVPGSEVQDESSSPAPAAAESRRKLRREMAEATWTASSTEACRSRPPRRCACTSPCIARSTGDRRPPGMPSCLLVRSRLEPTVGSSTQGRDGYRDAEPSGAQPGDVAAAAAAREDPIFRLVEAVEHLVGLQAQLPMNPYVGLWSRVRDFDPEALGRLVLDGDPGPHRGDAGHDPPGERRGLLAPAPVDATGPGRGAAGVIPSSVPRWTAWTWARRWRSLARCWRSRR